MNKFFENVYREGKVDRIKKFSNLTDEQKKEATAFYKSHTTGFDQYIDWQHPNNVKWEDFEKAFEAAKSTNSQKRKAVGKAIKDAKDDITKLFNRKDVIIQGENKDWIFVSPLTWEACKYFDSFECGGGKAKWCIGWERENRYWYNYVCQGFSFIMAFRKDFQEHENKDKDIKYMIEFQSFIESDRYDYDCLGNVWEQEDNVVKTLYGDEYESNIDMFNLSYCDLYDYSKRFWEEVFNKDPDLLTYDAREIGDDINFENQDEIEDTGLYYDFEKEFGKEAAEKASDLIEEVYDEFNLNGDFEWNEKVRFLDDDDNEHDGTLLYVVESFTKNRDIGDYWTPRQVNEEQAYEKLRTKWTYKSQGLSSIDMLVSKKAILGIVYQGYDFTHKIITSEKIKNYMSADDDDGKLQIDTYDSEHKSGMLIVDYKQLAEVRNYLTRYIGILLTNIGDTKKFSTSSIEKLDGFYNVTTDMIDLEGGINPILINCNIESLSTSGTATVVGGHVGHLRVGSSLQLFEDGKVDEVENLKNLGIIGNDCVVNKVSARDNKIDVLILGGRAIGMLKRLINSDQTLGKISLYNIHAKIMATVHCENGNYSAIDKFEDKEVPLTDEAITYYESLSLE